MADHETVCFTCSCPVGSDPFENRLPSGEACPTCRERILDEAPSLLPRTPIEIEDEAQEPVALDGDDEPPIGA